MPIEQKSENSLVYRRPKRKMSTGRDLYSFIENLPINMDLDLDALLDYMIECLGEVEYRFDDIKSILFWLTNGDETLWRDVSKYHQSRTNENRRKKETTLKPGTKITIPQPSANSKKFNDMESVQAYLSNYQSNDDSEDVDVTTINYTPTWNQYHIIEIMPKSTENAKTGRVLIEKQPTANVKKNIVKMEKTPIKESDNSFIDRTYMCTDCGRSYKQKSSLQRHSKLHQTGQSGIETPVKKTPRKKSSPKKSSTPRRPNTNDKNGNSSTFVPLENIESIST